MTDQLASAFADLEAAIAQAPRADIADCIGMLELTKTRALLRAIPVPSPDPQEHDRLLTAAEVAKILGVPVSCVRTLMRQRQLAVVTVGKKYQRVRESAVNGYIKQREEKPVDSRSIHRV